jgi:hypothetical protein
MQAFSKPVNVYVDTPLREIVNRSFERVKKVGLLVRVVYPELHARNILPALSSPFMVLPCPAVGSSCSPLAPSHSSHCPHERCCIIKRP